uniref:SUI1 domain-containing protein n=1 Tax=Cavia porcellus TaxID=10141 RepID=A0A286XLC5_CAVPO
MLAIQNLHSFNPFADASKDDDLLPPGTEDYIHRRTQQRKHDKKKLVKMFKKTFACNGTVMEHPEYGEVIRLQGDQQKNKFLVLNGLAMDDPLKVHGI